MDQATKERQQPRDDGSARRLQDGQRDHQHRHCYVQRETGQALQPAVRMMQEFGSGLRELAERVDGRLPDHREVHRDEQTRKPARPPQPTNADDERSQSDSECVYRRFVGQHVETDGSQEHQRRGHREEADGDAMVLTHIRRVTEHRVKVTANG